MPPCYEYRRATWTQVCELGPQGWRLVPVPPIAEMKQVLGQPQMGEPLYAMERQARPEGESAPGAGLLAGAFPGTEFEHPGMSVCNKGRVHDGPCDFGNGI
ncbi:MAG TPA: hypothetical protein VGH54_11965 [Mycobacterium sp.]|uniref:hypothetical protein n=1 Tax=Mycobacterium sp. TaxID=1785 RepID=UPI002F3EB405